MAKSQTQASASSQASQGGKQGTSTSEEVHSLEDSNQAQVEEWRAAQESAEHGHDHAHGPASRRPVAGLSSQDLTQTAQGINPQDSQEPRGMIGDAVNWAWGNLWWGVYKGAGDKGRQEAVLEAWKDRTLQDRIDALSPEQALDPDAYRNELGEVLDYLQQFEMMKAAGMTWEQMGKSQRDWMVAEATKSAEAKSGGAPVTQDDVLEAQQEQVADQDYSTQTEPDKTTWAGFTKGQRKAWRSRAKTAILNFLNWVQVKHPELDIKAGEIKPALRICEELNAVAYVEGDICYISMAVVEAIEKNPAYALSTVQHELRGHPEFDTGFNVGMALYDEAASGMPGYKKPGEDSDERNNEWERYEYFGSEIGALMREESYWVGSKDLDGDGTISADEENDLGSPLDLLDYLLENMQSNWEPKLLGAYVKSMARRFEADPRVSGKASHAFSVACTNKLGITP